MIVGRSPAFESFGGDGLVDGVPERSGSPSRADITISGTTTSTPGT
jgi:hypothetical protein